MENSLAKYALTITELGSLAGLSVREARESLRRLGLAQEQGRIDRVPPSAVRSFLTQNGFVFRTSTIACVNLRGGIGKTTCAITMASRASQYGFKTCVIDLDAQGSASLAFGLAPDEDEPVFYDVWQKPDEMTASALKQVDELLYLLPSSLQNGLLDVSLLNPATQKKAVAGVARALQEQGFDFLAIDCPPSLGAAVISSICAADELIVPLGSDAFSFKGLELTIQEVGSICEAFGLEQPRIRLLYSRHDRREKLAAAALERLQNEYGSLFFPEAVGTSTEFSRALDRKETIFASTGNSPAKRSYDSLTRDVLGLHSLSLAEST